MDIRKNVKSIDLVGEKDEQCLKIVFAYDSTHKRQTILNKLSGKTIKILTEKEKIPCWITAEEFNEKFPVGTPIKYYLIKGRPEFKTGRTTTPAWTLGHGEPVVTTDIMGGGLCLTHIEVLNEELDPEIIHEDEIPF